MQAVDIITEILGELQRTDEERQQIEEQYRMDMARLATKEEGFRLVHNHFVILLDGHSQSAWVDEIAGKVDFSGCDTHEQRARRIAMVTDGTVRPGQVAEILVAAGAASGSPKNLSGNVSKQLGESHYWERVQHGIYRLLDFSESNTEAGDT